MRGQVGFKDRHQQAEAEDDCRFFNTAVSEAPQMLHLLWQQMSGRVARGVGWWTVFPMVAEYDIF